MYANFNQSPECHITEDSIPQAWSACIQSVFKLSLSRTGLALSFLFLGTLPSNDIKFIPEVGSINFAFHNETQRI
jgi:hypothetical protein